MMNDDGSLDSHFLSTVNAQANQGIQFRLPHGFTSDILTLLLVSFPYFSSTITLFDFLVKCLFFFSSPWVGQYPIPLPCPIQYHDKMEFEQVCCDYEDVHSSCYISSSFLGRKNKYIYIKINSECRCLRYSNLNH